MRSSTAIIEAELGERLIRRERDRPRTQQLVHLPYDPRQVVALQSSVRDLGLDSLGSQQLRIELERRFGVSLPSTVLFECPTVDALADRILALRSSCEL